ncbi:MAG: (2Fe-2S)-binding protein [Deltaproteobacteria bacterium]|nr:(2Fe-2S)-binding protein [Deltaproteobacteria bacterium]
MIKRLRDLPTLRIDRVAEPLFIYRGRRYRGVAGDSIATALYANGVRIFSRSLKYHRPRGLYSLDGECSNCLMEVDGVPNVHTEKTRLKDGMNIRPQNVAGTLEYDFMSFIDRLDRFLPAGFYYHYFHRPYKLWPFFQNRLRNAAGLGRLRTSFSMKGCFDEIYPGAEVCVIGGGPAGMKAALAAADQGLRVILLEARPWLGGFFDYRSLEYEPGIPLYKRGRYLADQIEGRENIRCFLNTSMIGFYDENLITAFQVGEESDSFDERYIEIRAESVVVATGCIERPMIFDHNERPGIIQVNCAHRLARTYGIIPGTGAVFSIGDDLGLEAATDLYDLGMNVTCVADTRFDGQAPSLLEGLEKRNIIFLRGWAISESHGNKVLKRATLRTIDDMMREDFNCDTVVTSAGLTPAAGPLFLAKARMSYDHFTNFFLPEALPPKVHAAGRLLGLTDAHSIELSGRLAGLSAALDSGLPVQNHLKDAREQLKQLPGPARGSKLVQAPGAGRKRFICFDEDVTVKNIYQACDLGFDHVELVKRFTTAGLGPGQGNIPGHNLPMIVAQYLQQCGDSGAVMLPTRIRPPMIPTFLATYAGKSPEPVKRTPLHETMEKMPGAVFRRAGSWKRVRYFSNDYSCRKEIENVRNNVGMMDVSTLGKFRIFGPEALRALQRVYVGNMESVPEGRVKYSAMCNEDGCLVDDGVVVKRGDNDYYFTSSTNRADRTVEWIRYHTRHELWDFSMVNLTDAFGAVNLAGSRSREVLGMITDRDLSDKSFPYAGYREFLIKGGITVRAMRLGFVGELAYELHVPASYMRTVWDLLLEAGKPFGITTFGLEAQNVLRLEKGHVIIGQETEIRTTLHDLGMGFLWHREKSLYKTVGAPALRFTEHQEGRMKLVGFKTEDPSRPPKDGSIIVDKRIRGYVCTARYSSTLGESIGLALVHSELADIGTRLGIFEGDRGEKRLYATVVPTPFYDPEGKRLRM